MTRFCTREEIQSLRQQGQIVTIPETGEVFLLAGRKSRRLGTFALDGKRPRIAAHLGPGLYETEAPR